MASPRKATAINPFLILDGLLRDLLDHQGFCMSNSSYTQREGEDINEGGLHQHDLWEEWLGVAPPRLLQDHSASGDPHYTALVQTLTSSGELLVNGSEHSA